MDQFLPGDVSVMVLRYLAVSGCESAVFSMIGEMPVMKFYVPGQPPGLSNSEYVRMLGRPSLTPGLNDILNDYGQAKHCINEAITKQNSYGLTTSCDSLSTQLKHLLQSIENCKQKESRDSIVCPKVSKEFRDCGTNTDFEEAVDRRGVSGGGVEVETQTDFVKTIHVASADGGASVDVPLMFYNTLMTDSSLQEKLAMAINQQFADTKGSSSKNEVLQKACSTAETEIDRFLVDLLQDDDSCEDIGLGFIPSFSTTPVKEELPNVVICGIDTSLSSLFQDAHSLIAHELPKTVTQPVINVTDPAKKSVSFNLELVSTPPTAVRVEVESASADSGSTPFKDEQPKAGPSRPVNYVPKKRINLKPAPKVQPNPVFEKVQLVERTVTSDGQPYSVHTTRPVISNWEKLGRKPIAPKIPGRVPQNQVNSTPIKTISEVKSSANTEVISSQKTTVLNSASKRKSRLTTPMKLTPEKAKNSDFNFVLVCHEPSRQTVGMSSSDSQASPVKLQVHDAGLPQPSTQQAIVDHYVNSPNDLPAIVGRMSQTPIDKPLEILALKNSSNIQVTPILDLPEEAMHRSIPKSISPRVKRLFMSAQKIRATSTQFGLARKSFSSPRKKKHVRSLQFTTPPRLKAKTRTPEVSPPSKIANSSQKISLPVSLPQKRKCNDSLQNEGKPKSKKRLHQSSEEDGYQSSAFPDRNFSMKKMTDSMIESAKRVFTTREVNSAMKEVQKLTDLRCSELTSSIGFDTANHLEAVGLFNTKQISQPPDFENKNENRSKINKLPKILEESLSSLPESTKVSVVDAPVFSSSPTPSVSEKTHSQTKQFLQTPNNFQTFTLHILENSNLSNPELTVVAESPIKATPLKNDPVPFSILPPISFPDPTPTKMDAPSELMTKTSSHALITPMKSDSTGTTDSNVMFPIPPTPTPRYIVGEPDTDSNTAMSFGRMETLYLATLCNSTPSKLLGPPPTPGKNFGRHFGSSSNIVGTNSSHALEVSVQTIERPLDLSSPIAPHRKTEPLIDSVPQTLPSVDARTATFLVAEKPPENNTYHKGSEFQVPVGAPKRVSPTGPHNRRQALIRNLSGNLISPKPVILQRSTAALAGPGTKFQVGDATKTLSISEYHSLLNLSSDITRERSPSIPKVDPSKFKSFLKNLDVNNFLSKMHKPNLNS